MLTRQEETKQKYGGAITVVDTWLAERRELLVKYCQLAGLPPFEANKNSLPDVSVINDFCQILVDYLSAGHFEVYDDIVQQCNNRNKESAELAERVYPLIADTTQPLVDFNDKYSNVPDGFEYQGFDLDLADVGSLLEQRMELEDELIHTLYSKHS